MSDASQALTDFGIAHEVEVVSAHRTPDKLMRYGREARTRGLRGDHRRSRRRRPPSRHAGLAHCAARSSACPCSWPPRRDGLAAEHRADARRASRSRTVSINGAQERRAARGAHPRRPRTPLSPTASRQYARDARGAGRAEEPAAQGVAVSVMSPPARRPPVRPSRVVEERPDAVTRMPRPRCHDHAAGGGSSP